MFFQAGAIIILLLFYGCYFGKMFLQKKKGIQTDQIGKGKTGRVKAIELTMKVATILVPLTEVLSIYTNYSLSSGVLRYAGAVIAKANDQEQLLTCDIDLNEVKKVRNNINYLSLRRPEQYE